MKKQLSFALALCLMSGMVSCGNTPVSPSNETKPVETTAPDPHPLLSALPDADFGGYDFRICGEIQKDHYEVEEQTGEVVDDAVWSRNSSVSERYNVKLTYQLVEWKKGPDLIKNSVMAGDNAFDLATCTHLYLGGLLTSGCFLDWNTIPNVDLTKPYYTAAANETYSLGDKTMLLFGDFMDSNLTKCWVYLFNKRLADEYRLGDLYETARSGKWTYDFLRKSIMDLHSDLDGNTVFDKHDFYGLITDIYAAVDAYARSFGFTAITKDENNLPKLDFWRESTADAYQKLYDLYYNTPGLFVHEGSGMENLATFAEGNSVFTTAQIAFLNKEELRNMADDYGILPYPKLNETDDIYATFLSGTYSAQMIPSSAPASSLERTGILTEALNAYSHELVFPALYDVSIKNKAARDAESVEMLDLVVAGRRYSFDSLDEQKFKLSPVCVLRNNIQKNVESIASYYEANRASCEGWITSMIEAVQN